MDEILADRSEPALANATKANFYAFWSAMERVPSVAHQRGPALMRWHTRIAHPLFQGALVTQPAPGDEARLARETRDYFAANGVRGFCWWFDPAVDQAPWREPLRALGFTPEDDPPGMALVLDELVEPELPAGLRIVRVADAETLRWWNQTFMTGYGLPPHMAEPFAEILAAFGDAMHHYLGYLDDVPVATSSLFAAAGVAGIYNVATLPVARGRGVGAAMTVAPLRDMRARGYRAAILQTSEMGFRVYQRLGFRHVCAMDHFVWRAGRS